MLQRFDTLEVTASNAVVKACCMSTEKFEEAINNVIKEVQEGDKKFSISSVVLKNICELMKRNTGWPSNDKEQGELAGFWKTLCFFWYFQESKEDIGGFRFNDHHIHMTRAEDIVGEIFGMKSDQIDGERPAEWIMGPVVYQITSLGGLSEDVCKDLCKDVSKDLCEDQGSSWGESNRVEEHTVEYMRREILKMGRDHFVELLAILVAVYKETESYEQYKEDILKQLDTETE